MQNKYKKCQGKIMKNSIYKKMTIRVNQHKIYKKSLNHKCLQK